MKILVMGSGAIGSLFAGLLSKNNHVTIIGRKDHVDKINKNGLKIIGKTSINVKIPSFETLDTINFQPDLILLTVKSYDTEIAIIDLLKILGKKTVILTIQNGLNNLEKTEDKTPIYKSVGAILIKMKGKSEVTKELKSNKESLEIRKNSLEKQEGSTKEKLNELQSRVQNALSLSSSSN